MSWDRRCQTYLWSGFKIPHHLHTLALIVLVPFTVKNGRKISKRYGLIVTCLSTRAIHIEYLDDMTSDAFINGLRCVIAIRGPIPTIKCDQGSNFQGAAHALKVAMAENLEEDVIKRYLISQNCEFAFNRSIFQQRFIVF